jgi:tetratricopeptide (TPR) repeat protein
MAKDRSRERNPLGRVPGGKVSQQRRSLQDLIQQRQASGFIGRHKEVTEFQEMLKLPAEERRSFLLNIHGNAGVGKTYLSKRMRRIADESGALTAYTDETIDNILAAMGSISDEFARRGVRLSGFEKRYVDYQKRRHEVESDPKAPEGVGAFLSKTAITIGLNAARDVPFAGSVLAPVDDAAVADQVNRALVYLVQKFSDHAERRLLLSPAEELTPVFVADLNQIAAADRPVVLLFDTYEDTALILDKWLRELYAGRYGDLPADLITIISGQYPLNPNLWGEYYPVIADFPLEPFSDAEARQLLAGQNITDDRTINVIITLSGRLPLLISMLADAYPENPADIGDPTGSAVERYLKWENDPLRRSVAITAALPRRLNEDVLAVLTKLPRDGALFSWLTGLPFVTQHRDGWKYHPVVRSAMLRLQRMQSPSDWRDKHSALALAHSRWASEVLADSTESWTIPEWVDQTCERTYHLLCSDPAKNLPLALVGAVKAAENGLARARQWAELISDAGRDAEHAELREWGERLRKSVLNEDLISYLTSLVNDAGLDSITCAIALEQRAQYHNLAANYELALADFTRAIELEPDQGTAILNRAFTNLQIGRQVDALADFTRAIEIDPDQGLAIAMRSLVYFQMGRPGEALADSNRAIELGSYPDWIIASLVIASLGAVHRTADLNEALADSIWAIEPSPDQSWSSPDQSWPIAMRSLVQLQLGRHNEALADAIRAAELDTDQDWIIAIRGIAYFEAGRRDEALADFNRAIELDPANAWAIVARGEAFRQMQRYEEALADFNRAIELNPEQAWTILARGEAFGQMQRYEEALADFNRAIELNPANAWAIASRGEAFRQMQRYEEALADFNRAVVLDPAFAWAIASRGQTFHAMGRYDDALTDLSRAIELDPDRDWVIASRGETYRAMGRYDDALTDLSRAIELNPAYAWAIAHRGETYLAMRRDDDALTDLNRAIEINPDQAWAIANRAEVYRWMERYEQALADFNRAIEIDPAQGSAIAYRGLTYAMIGRHDDALADLNRAIELNPDAGWPFAVRGEALLEIGHHDNALTDLNRAIEIDPAQGLAIANRGLIYMVMGRHDEALADFNRTIELNPDEGWPFAVRGEALLEIGRHDDALADFNRAIETDSDEAWIIRIRQEARRTLGRGDDGFAQRNSPNELDQAPNGEVDPVNGKA